MLKRAIAIAFLIIFTFSMVGFFLVFKIQQYQVRKEIKHLIKNGLPETQLVQININSRNQSELKWEDENEFRYQGAMYDVVRIEKKDDSTIIYYCVSDEQETILFANLDEQVKKNMDSKNNGINPIKNLFKILSTLHYTQDTHTSTFFQIKESGEGEFAFVYFSPALDILSPPPKMI
jgi:hypothetical protein